VQLATSTQNARLDAIEVDIGPSPTLRLRTGPPPTNCAAADTGTVCATMTLPADWMAPAASGTKAKQGTWQDGSADAAGTIGHYRIYDSAGICKLQGTVTITGGGGEMTLDNNVVATGQQITVVSYTWTDGNG